MDFALARLEGVGRERSMHFDPRWTHEELNWWVGTGGRGAALLEVGWKDWAGGCHVQRAQLAPCMRRSRSEGPPMHACALTHARILHCISSMCQDATILLTVCLPSVLHPDTTRLPRRERDKRRILKEGWMRTQWGGFAAGGNR